MVFSKRCRHSWSICSSVFVLSKITKRNFFVNSFDFVCRKYDFLFKNVVKRANCNLAHLQTNMYVMCLSISRFHMGAGSYVHLPTSLFEHLPCGPGSQPTDTEDHIQSVIRALTPPLGRATTECVSSAGDWASSIGGHFQ